MTFLSEQAHLASWLQCCLYIRQSIKHMQQSSENAYNGYVKLLLGLKGVCSASWFNIQTKISIILLLFFGNRSKTLWVQTFFRDSTCTYIYKFLSILVKLHRGIFIYHFKKVCQIKGPSKCNNIIRFPIVFSHRLASEISCK